MIEKQEEITKRGDQYAKRMLVRKKEQNQSYESYSKSLQRRKKIMEAISKNKLTASTNPQPAGTTSAQDSINLEEEKSYVSTWPYTEEEEAHLSSETYSVAAKQSLSPPDANSNNIEYRRSSQFRRDILNGLINSSDKRKSSFPDWQSPSQNLPRISLGEYFGSKSHKEMRSENFLGKTCEKEFVRYDDEVKHQNNRESMQLFGARVMGVLEPEVTKVERSSMAFVQENFLEQMQNNPDFDSTITSFVSEDVRELDREIEKLEIQPTVLQRTIPETPKGIYPNLSPMKRMSENFTPKKLFHVDRVKIDSQRPVKEPNYERKQNVRNKNQRSERQVEETYSTPMPISTPQMNKLDQSREDRHSFFKGNSSFLFSNLPKLMYRNRKPNLESTRKIFNSGGNPMSPSSQIGTTISTLTLPNTPSSPDAYEAVAKTQQVRTCIRQDDDELTIPYEVQNFLKLALGDDHCYSTVTYTNAENMRNRTNSCINASELISEDRTPVKKRNQRVPMSAPPKHSSTLNRSLTIYKTLTKSLRKKFRKNSKDEAKPTKQCTIPYDMNPHIVDDVKKLLDQMEMYQTQIYQASKALDLCTSMREFQASSERVELERLLIIANLKKQAIREEIRCLTSYVSEKNVYCQRAELTLKEISLQLREDIIRRERHGGEIVEWFLVVISEGLTVWATHAVACPMTGPRIYFPGKLSIPELTPDFRLRVSVYSMKLQPIIYNHEDKYHIGDRRDSAQHSRTCPSPQVLLGRNEKKKTMMSPKQYEIRFSGIKETAFVLCGSVELLLHDLNLISPWPLSGVPSNSLLHGTIDMSLECRLQLSVSHSGFLTHGDEPGGFVAWSRRWCVLEGRRLLFWNYPREQECKPPHYEIDLVHCVSRCIQVVDRSLCARPRTLLIETARKRSPADEDSFVIECRSSCTVVRNLLSCDTQQDLIEWQVKLNHVVSALREWNVIDTKSPLQISDL